MPKRGAAKRYLTPDEQAKQKEEMDFPLPKKTDVCDCQSEASKLLGSYASDARGLLNSRDFMRLMKTLDDKHGWTHSPDEVNDEFKEYERSDGMVDRDGLVRLLRKKHKVDYVEVVPKPKLTCAYCGKVDTQMMRCGRCKGPYYCSGRCQKEHWETHKPDCKPHYRAHPTEVEAEKGYVPPPPPRSKLGTYCAGAVAVVCLSSAIAITVTHINI